MKKQFFYAAFAIAMMASCTSEDTPLVEQPTAPEDDRVAIELGVDAPTVTASSKASRGTGSVGGTGVTGDENNWNKQRLYITMVDKDGKIAQDYKRDDQGNYLNDAGEVVNTKEEAALEDILTWDNYEYRAPATGSSADIRIYSSYTADSDNGVLKYVYYPVNGTYDFYGWHVDAEADAENGTPNIAQNVAEVTAITIDGTQDIMGARTKEFNSENYQGWTSDLDKWAFSARTARADIKPILKFEHQLARLKFFVRAGSEETAETLDNGTANNTPDGQSHAMFVTALSVRDLVNKIDMNLKADGKPASTPAADAEEIDFKLGSRIDGVVTPGTLTSVAPAKKYVAGDESTKGVQVGESIMFLPNGESVNDLVIDLTLQQHVINTEDEAAADESQKYTYIEKRQDATVTVHAASLLNGVDTEKIFKPGRSYNIYITIYGFERIEVTAELTAWENGGDIDVDIEEEESVVPEETPATTDVTVNVNGLEEGETADNITVVDAEGTNVDAAEGKYTLTVGATYTVTVTETGYTQSESTKTFTITEGQTAIEVTMTKDELEVTTVKFTVNPSVQGEVTLTVDGATVEKDNENYYSVEDGKTVTWTVVVTNDDQTTTTYSSTFTVSSSTTEVTLTCDDSIKKQD